MKNTAVDILGYKEVNKDIKEWFDEECRQLLEQKSKAYQVYLARLTRARAECEEKRKWVIIACRKEKGWVINQQFIAIEEEFKE